MALKTSGLVCFGLAATCIMLAESAVAAAKPSRAAWKDPSPHRVEFVSVDAGVRLEVLDWGGSGRAIVLLAGSGNTAHIFDDFAPKLTDCCHVYGITRRGYGASSQPASGYGDQRLADDVLRVIESLDIASPVLVGHSMAGGELTTLGNQHSDRLGGLVYLSALGDPKDWPASDPAYMDLVKRLPPPPVSPPCKEDRKSFGAFRKWQECRMKFAEPESEFRNAWSVNPDDSVGDYKTPGRINDAIGAGMKKRDYSGIRVPVLAISESPPPTSIDQLGPDDPQPRNDEERAAQIAFGLATKAYVDRWVSNLKRSVPDARIVELAGAGHYVYLTRERDVLREMHDFVAQMSPGR
jgi:non-heme chloroperoxidase